MILEVVRDKRATHARLELGFRQGRVDRKHLVLHGLTMEIK
jgi:hypothetical protein